MHEPFRRIADGRIESRFDQLPTPPDQLRWDPLPMPSAATPIDFVDGLVTMAGNGAPALQNGCGIHLYAANRSMQDRFFYDADGELLIVPQQGRLRFDTELGRIAAAPQEIVVIPRGVRFRVELPRRRRRAAMSAKISAPRSSCPTWGRSAPMASPIRATS